MSLCPARVKKIQMKTKALVFTTFLLLHVFVDFLRHSGAADCAVHIPIRLNFKLSPALMGILLTCKNEQGSIKNEGARVFTTLMIDFSDAQGQLTPQSLVGFCQNSNSFKHLCMSLLHARMMVIQLKLKGLQQSVQNTSPILSLWGFFQTLKGSKVCCSGSDLAKFQTYSRYHGCPCYLQESRNSNQKRWRQSVNNIFPLLSYGRYLLPWKPAF